MGSSKIRRALGAVKDKTSIGLAKVGSSNSLSDLEVAVVKATRHEENPAEEKHIREILSLTCYSRANISSCVNILSKRLTKTRNWIVALKTLILIHRLLSEGDPAYEQEIFFATRRGTRLLNMSDFCDASRSNSWDFSAFVRTFALCLDDRLEFRMHGKRNKRSDARDDDDEVENQNGFCSAKSTPVRDLKNERLFSRMQHLQQLLERFLACRPTGAAKSNRVVMVALYPLIKDSFQIYYDVAEIMGILIDRFMEMEVNECVKVSEIFTRISKQFDELDMFYQWSKSVGLARSSEYPDVEKITQKKLEIMEEFIRDKSALVQSRKTKIHEQRVEEILQDAKIEDPNDDMTTIKALPAPEVSSEVQEEQAKERPPHEDEESTALSDHKEADLLNINSDNIVNEEQGDKLALALFAEEPKPASSPPWEAFEDESDGWETALVQSVSNLSGQKPSLGGGFDVLLLDRMYQQTPFVDNGGTTGSASSVAFQAVKPGQLALPALDGYGDGNDPFSASSVIPPPSFVQMSEMEKKQKLLVEEQLMWQQYAKEGMQGHLPVMHMHSNYTMGTSSPGFLS